MAKNIEVLVDLGLKSGRLVGPMKLVTSLTLVKVEDAEGLAIPTELGHTASDMRTLDGIPQGQRIVLSLGEKPENSRFVSWRDVLVMDKENATALHEQLTNVLERWK